MARFFTSKKIKNPLNFKQIGGGMRAARGLSSLFFPPLVQSLPGGILEDFCFFDLDRIRGQGLD